MEKVKIVSTVKNSVHVVNRDLRFDRTWPMAGATVSVNNDILEDLMYDVGFRNMIESGMLYIEDMQVKKDLGIEPEEATEPTNVIVLSDKEKRSYLTALSLVGFKDKIKKLSKVQLEELCDFAIENRLLDVDKANVLKEACGRDIIAAVRLNEQNKEA